MTATWQVFGPGRNEVADAGRTPDGWGFDEVCSPTSGASLEPVLSPASAGMFIAGAAMGQHRPVSGVPVRLDALYREICELAEPGPLTEQQEARWNQILPYWDALMNRMERDVN